MPSCTGTYSQLTVHVCHQQNGMQANTAFSGGAGSGIFSSGTALAQHFSPNVPIDEGMVYAVVTNATRAAASVSAPLLMPEPYLASARDGVTVSPCGPPLLQLPASECSVVNGSEAGVTYHLTSKSASLSCAATLTTAAGEWPSDACRSPSVSPSQLFLLRLQQMPRPTCSPCLL
jgi:hypothetical protein